MTDKSNSGEAGSTQSIQGLIDLILDQKKSSSQIQLYSQQHVIQETTEREEIDDQACD